MRRRTRIELPRMSASQAIDLLDILERITEAVWRAHGDDMVAHPRLGGPTHPADCWCHPDDADDGGHSDDDRAAEL